MSVCQSSSLLYKISKTLIYSLMIKFGIERVYGKGHHKSVYQKALEKLERYRDKMAQYDYYNSLFDGRNSFSKTDTDATFMHMKEDHMRNGQLKPGYNIQAAVEGEYIVGIDVSSERSDVNTLIPFLSKLNDLELFVLKNIICEEGLGVCALKQLISPVNMFFTLMV